MDDIGQFIGLFLQFIDDVDRFAASFNQQNSMNRFLYSSFFVALMAVLFLSGCTGTMKSMREPNSRVEFQKSDFNFSEQLTGEATSTKILMIDWARLFKAESGVVEGGSTMVLPIDVASLPVIGTVLYDRTSGYALYDLMQKNPGYDVVFYPQYETTVNRPIGLGFIVKKTTVKVTARLGKIN